MPVQRKNPLKLNNLQLRTLVLAQIIAKDPNSGSIDEATGDAPLLRIPHAHGDHVHANPAVWVALARKGLAREGYPASIVLTREGMEYDTGLSENFVEESDH